MGRTLYPEESDEVKKNSSTQNGATRIVHRTERRGNQARRSSEKEKTERKAIPTGVIIAATVAAVAIGVTIAVIVS